MEALLEAYKALEKAQDALRRVDVGDWPPDQRRALDRLDLIVELCVEQAFSIGNAQDPTG